MTNFFSENDVCENSLKKGINDAIYKRCPWQFSSRVIKQITLVI